MTERVAFVLKGFIELDVNERKEFIDEVNKFIKGSESIQQNFSMITESVVLGPVNKTCPCCGR
jgi:hypothetical protein